MYIHPPAAMFNLYSLSCCLFFLRVASVPLAESQIDTRALPALPNVPRASIPFYNFPSGSIIEKNYPRSNGQLLVSLTSTPDIYQIDPTKNQTGELIYHFPGYQSAQGIAELQKDVFIITLGNYSDPPVYEGHQGTYAVWKLDLTCSPPCAEKITDVPYAINLDGIITANEALGLLIATDTTRGLLYRVDIPNRSVVPILTDPLFQRNSAGISGIDSIGVDGIEFRGNELYFTNFIKGLFGKVPFNKTFAQPLGPAQLVYNASTIMDGFAVTQAGNFFVTEAFQGITLIRGSQSDLISPFAGVNGCTFRRNPWPIYNTLYSTYYNPALNSSGLASIDVTGIS